jgi:hypothetical protein
MAGLNYARTPRGFQVFCADFRRLRFFESGPTRVTISPGVATLWWIITAIEAAARLAMDNRHRAA